MTLTPATYYLFIICGFLGMVSMPYVTDWVYFVFDDSSSWLGASVGAALIVASIIVVIMRTALHFGWV